MPCKSTSTVWGDAPIPTLDPATVTEMWAESVGLDPGATPPPLKLARRQCIVGTRCTLPAFCWTAEANGSAFLGKEISLDLRLADEQDNNNVEVSLNNIHA